MAASRRTANEQMLLLQTLIGALADAARGPSGAARPPGAVHGQVGEGSEGQHQLDSRRTSAGRDAPPRVRGGPVSRWPLRDRTWKGLEPFAQRIAQIGMHSALSQVVLKIASPGVPDFYQGNELWDLSLVDPDNRRPVDFQARTRMLDELRGSSLARPELARQLYASWPDGRIKLFLVHAALQGPQGPCPRYSPAGGTSRSPPVGSRAAETWPPSPRTGPDRDPGGGGGAAAGGESPGWRAASGRALSPGRSCRCRG